MKVADLQINSKLYPIGPNKVNGKSINPQRDVEKKKTEGTQPFSKILQDKIDSQKQLKFSAHAVKRLEQRSVRLSEHELSRLDNGLKQLDEKGSRNSLILVDDTAYIVSVKNKTVVTALKNAEALNNVFTNIDSVAIV